MHVCAYVYVDVYGYMVCVHESVGICVHVCACVSVRVYGCLRVCVCVCSAVVDVLVPAYAYV